MAPKIENINVRLDADLKRRAETVAHNCGSSVSMVLRLLLEKLVQYSDAHGGKIVMPPDFVEYDISPKNGSDKKRR